MRSGMVYYSHREGITSEGKEVSKMMYDNNFDRMVDEALAQMEAEGETLPEIRYGESED